MYDCFTIPSWFLGVYLQKAEGKTIELIKAGDSFPEIPMQIPEKLKNMGLI